MSTNLGAIEMDDYEAKRRESNKHSIEYILGSSGLNENLNEKETKGSDKEEASHGEMEDRQDEIVEGKFRASTRVDDLATLLFIRIIFTL